MRSLTHSSPGATGLSKSRSTGLLSPCLTCWDSAGRSQVALSVASSRGVRSQQAVTLSDLTRPPAPPSAPQMLTSPAVDPFTRLRPMAREMAQSPCRQRRHLFSTCSLLGELARHAQGRSLAATMHLFCHWALLPSMHHLRLVLYMLANQLDYRVELPRPPSSFTFIRGKVRTNYSAS